MNITTISGGAHWKNEPVTGIGTQIADSFEFYNRETKKTTIPTKELINSKGKQIFVGVGHTNIITHLFEVSGFKQIF